MVVIMRSVRFALVLAGAVLCSACFQFSTVLTLKADGSGTIAQRLLFTQAAVAQLLQHHALGGGAGAHLAIAIEPAGRLVRTSSPYVNGQRVTLVDVNVDSLLSDDTLLQRLQAARTPDETRTILKSVPGLKVNLDPEITIEFDAQ